jgi:hypothetical protein
MLEPVSYVSDLRPDASEVHCHFDKKTAAGFLRGRLLQGVGF